MKYQIQISEKNSHKRDCIVLKPHISIKSAAYWQKRIWALIPKAHVTVRVAKGHTI